MTKTWYEKLTEEIEYIKTNHKPLMFYYVVRGKIEMAYELTALTEGEYNTLINMLT